MNKYTEIITKYINGELSDSDKLAFEKELITDQELKKEYEIQLQVVEGVKRLGLKKELKSSFKKVKQQKLIKKVIIGTAITIAVLGAVAIIKNVANRSSSEVLYELNEEGKTNWAEADKKIESQVFTLDPSHDTIIETREGIVLAIKANSFLNAQGKTPDEPIDLEIKEAMTPYEIMKSGLNTMSGDKLLETGGMFYINARDGEENLKIDPNKPLNVNVPMNNSKSDMMLFKGERKADGTINWTDPKPMKRKLTTVDITKLNFYPEHFLDTLKAMGYGIKNKQLTDSIYYSYSGNCHFNEYNSPPNYETESESAYSFDEAIGVSDSAKSKPSGEMLFKQNCAVCHSLSSQKITGPGLAGILNRVPSGDWLKRYILNNSKVKHSGDPYANILTGFGLMPMFEFLSDEEVNSIINYMTGREGWIIDNLQNGSEGCDEINPSRIRAIWDKKFDHTILATKEFEERLEFVFKTCNSNILNLYINNLNKNLYEIDSLAATMVSGDLKSIFLEFAARKDGGVEITDRQSEKLQKYFDEKRKIYSEAVNKSLQKMYEKEAKENQVAFEKEMKHWDNEAIRSSNTFQEELKINMDEAYRQLGKKKPEALPADNYISGDIIQTGWNNVDRYVTESTINRTTLNYTDPETGKKAIIKYEPINVSVNDFKNYDRVVSYIVPDKLSSFQLMKSSGNGFKENLNELMNYSIVTIGFKGNSTYYSEIKHAKAQAYTISLASIKETELKNKLNKTFPLNQQQDLTQEINYQLFDLKETVRQNKIKKREEIRSSLYPIVFPCASLPDAQSTEIIPIEDLDFEANHH